MCVEARSRDRRRGSPVYGRDRPRDSPARRDHSLDMIRESPARLDLNRDRGDLSTSRFRERDSVRFAREPSRELESRDLNSRPNSSHSVRTLASPAPLNRTPARSSFAANRMSRVETDVNRMSRVETDDLLASVKQKNVLLDELFDVDIEQEPFETVGGLIFGRLGSVPRPGEAVESHGLRLMVERIDGRRIRSILVEKLAAGEEAEGE